MLSLNEIYYQHIHIEEYIYVGDVSSRRLCNNFRLYRDLLRVSDGNITVYIMCYTNRESQKYSHI